MNEEQRKQLLMDEVYKKTIKKVIERIREEINSYKDFNSPERKALAILLGKMERELEAQK